MNLKIDAVSKKNFSCEVCPYYPNCENDTCEEAYEEYIKRQREKAIDAWNRRANVCEKSV